MISVAALFLFAAVPESETADHIMARVAENQNRSQQMRTSFVYHQNVLVRLNRSNGKLGREEYSEFTVTPTATGTVKECTLFRGKYMDHGRIIEFDRSGYQHANVDIDADLARDLARDLTGDKRSRDGIEHDLFPLRSKMQRRYIFKLEGVEDYRDIPVYRITFVPKKTSFDDDHNGAIWAGEVLVHRQEYQPVLITTHMVAKIPFAVKTMLGTDVQQLGFKVTYQKFDEGLWFPVTYGGEFKLKALFLYARRVGISMQNYGFRRAQTESKISFAEIR